MTNTFDKALHELDKTVHEQLLQIKTDAHEAMHLFNLNSRIGARRALIQTKTALTSPTAFTVYAASVLGLTAYLYFRSRRSNASMELSSLHHRGATQGEVPTELDLEGRGGDGFPTNSVMGGVPV